MSEAWAIAIATILSSALITVCAMIYKAISGMRDAINELNKTIGNLVKKADCDRLMDGHCRKIEEIGERLADVERDISVSSALMDHEK